MRWSVLAMFDFLQPERMKLIPYKIIELCSEYRPIGSLDFKFVWAQKFWYVESEVPVSRYP